MRDICGKTLPKDTVYKDVVVIGNGPSGICLSYMLSGHWPYWDPEKAKIHPDELLRARLNYADNTKSLVLQDLTALADGLEGRSTNPVSLLLDSLQNPCADLGMELPSMLSYKYHPEKQIDHVVLGKGPPGGSWHRMDPNLRTLSLSAWMSLPGLDFSAWETTHPAEPQYPTTHDLVVKRKLLEQNNRSINNDSAGPVTIVIDQTRTNNNCLNKSSKKSKNTLECRKCIELRERLPNPVGKGKYPPQLQNNNESEVGALCCKCSKVTAQHRLIDENGKFYRNGLRNDETYEQTGDSVTRSHGIPTIDTQPSDSSSSNNRNNMLMLPKRNLSLQRQVSKEVQTRALVSRVAEYYESYVNEMGLLKYFVNDTTVTSIQPLQWSDQRCKNIRWIVHGTKSSGKPFTYICRNVVLANGASDLPNRLGLRGEHGVLPWIKHELPQLEVALEKLTAQERSKMKPVLVVGAGLSAADAVTICRSSKVPVIHVYRNRSAGLDKMLPENVYPEYHAVHKMMKNSSIPYDLYTPLAEHTITDLKSSTQSTGVHHVTVQHLKTGEHRQLEVSYCAILIGSRPDLRFLSTIGTKHQADNTNIVLRTNETNTLVSTNSNNNCPNANNNNNRLIVEEPTEEQWSLLSRRISWLKNMCVKCKHLNFCEWSRRNDYKKICGHNAGKNCECHKINNPSLHTAPASNDEIKQMKILTEERLSTLGLGEDPFKPIDCKSNPIAVNKYTNEVLKTPPGLYSMGPLVGDNFVRFIPGGALAITSALHREND